ncbi:family 43 glycosylhydrolase [Flavivirga eckloniae]|uniref:Carbohydrate-binding protein n=1 Tax=Flavivirga eckloniae TaxID=1803846 RepID=A0A2K9PNN7_9FLAO|nr:family 43 glycosylhydrolase [Flavivirga eckloniae]AUP78438.1 carbohydrate-binding protein [Flavivirga eckloniae]
MSNLFKIMAVACISCLMNCNMQTKEIESIPTTFCNPIDISYRFCLGQEDKDPSRREAADPVIVTFKGQYYLFASKSGGYWSSDDLATWAFIETDDLPLEKYAPGVFAIGDTIYYMGSSRSNYTLHKTTDPQSGNWELAAKDIGCGGWDPDFFLDDDKRLYMYWGSGSDTYIFGIELDYANDFKCIGEPIALFKPDRTNNGWERRGDNNEDDSSGTYNEGAFMNKHNGKYYLQYATPGTQFKIYADGVYVADNPLGPFVLQAHNPISFKPGGYIPGAGHGSTFADKYGNYWHITSGVVRDKQAFERRLVMYPTFFDEEGVMYCNTKFGDYPMLLPQKKITKPDDFHPGWMLLSYKKDVTVSSSLDEKVAENMVDENIRTYWAAQSGESSEWASIDLGEEYLVRAIQLNFAEHNAQLYGRVSGIKHRYSIDYSSDGKAWQSLVDQSKSETDNTHNYFQLNAPVSCRYIRVNNKEVPGGSFAISGLRVFGDGNEDHPGPSKIVSSRDKEDKCSVKLSWTKSENAIGYHIKFGLSPDKLYNNVMVFDTTSYQLNCLNASEEYFFDIEPFNESSD